MIPATLVRRSLTGSEERFEILILAILSGDPVLVVYQDEAGEVAATHLRDDVRICTKLRASRIIPGAPPQGLQI